MFFQAYLFRFCAPVYLELRESRKNCSLFLLSASFFFSSIPFFHYGFLILLPGFHFSSLSTGFHGINALSRVELHLFHAPVDMAAALLAARLFLCLRLILYVAIADPKLSTGGWLFLTRQGSHRLYILRFQGDRFFASQNQHLPIFS